MTDPVQRYGRRPPVVRPHRAPLEIEEEGDKAFRAGPIEPRFDSPNQLCFVGDIGAALSIGGTSCRGGVAPICVLLLAVPGRDVALISVKPGVPHARMSLKPDLHRMRLSGRVEDVLHTLVEIRARMLPVFAGDGPGRRLLGCSFAWNPVDLYRNFSRERIAILDPRYASLTSSSDGQLPL